MLLPFSVILVSITGVLASYSANRYIDSVLSPHLLSELRTLHLEPAPLPNFATEFSDKILFVKTKGVANYTEGRLNGLGNMSRNSECQGPSLKHGASHINCSIAMYNLTTEHKSSIKYGALPKITVRATSNIGKTVLFIDFVHHPSQPPRVHDLRIISFGQVQPEFSGLGVLNKVLTFLNDGYKSTVAAGVFSVLTQQLKEALSRAALRPQWPM